MILVAEIEWIFEISAYCSDWFAVANFALRFEVLCFELRLEFVECDWRSGAGGRSIVEHVCWLLVVWPRYVSAEAEA